MKQRIFNVCAVLMMMALAGIIAVQAESARQQQPQGAPQQNMQQQAPQQEPQPSQTAQQVAEQQQASRQQPCLPAPPQINQSQYQYGPQVNIGKRHGNMRQAQIFLVQAYQAMQQAQQANEDQLAGHAQHAKDLMLQADVEIRLAANVSNQEGH